MDSNARLSISSVPYNHLLIDQVFEPAVAAELELVFRELIAGGKRIGDVGEGKSETYEAIGGMPRLEHFTNSAISQLASPELKSFMADVFNIELNENLMLALHQHNPPSKAGWIHTDFAIVSFPSTAPNLGQQRVFLEDSGVLYADDSQNRQPHTIKTARAIACIYYIGHPQWQREMKGETGLYARDGKTLALRVPPRNNSLLAFEITPHSFHAYMGSRLLQRNTFIWWYHAEPSYMVQRNEAAYFARQKSGRDPWDRWTDATTEKYRVPGYD